SVKSHDAIIIGGGIIGLSLALELRKRSMTVLIIDRAEPGREASHAAGGMLVDSPDETASHLQPLATTSAKMFPEFVRELEIESGMKIDLRDQGTIVLHSSENPRGQKLSPADLATLEPALGETNRPAIFLQERSVDPRQLTAAALHAGRRLGVDFSSGDPVTAINFSDDHVSGVTTTKTSFFSEIAINCAGAWAGQIAPRNFPTRPVKGQMLYLVAPRRDLLKHVIRAPEAYIIPRSDGRILVGTTMEEAGFDKRTDPAVIQRLHRAGIALVPDLRDAKILEDWAGLRPGTPDAIPILGATSTPGYYAATGHFRDGILLAPITAKLMAQVISGSKPALDLTPFSLARFTNAA
ncbi:MAG TPA: glycine oxidase ThiO, partial [Candidatus Binatia bacterium]|nr:glycine oxidase ThiO [Candidatus Binatia bacterium]